MRSGTVQRHRRFGRACASIRSNPHAHLSSPLDGKPLIDPKRIHLVAGEFDQIVPVKTLRRLTAAWGVENLEIVPQGHFGYVAMNRVLRRLGLVLVVVLGSGVATDLRCILA
jgi:pimeloyl-ACP methyl ester carboxylesterase